MIEPMRRAYLAAYDRRRRVNPAGLPFPRLEPSALAGLAYARGAPSLADKERPTACLRAVSRALLAEPEHSAAVDVTGVAWIEAYGLVPMSGPPAEHVTWIYDRGSGSGTVRGPIAMAWRTAFLAVAWPLLGHEHRPGALRELERRTSALATAIEQFRSRLSQAGGVSLAARLLFASAQAASWTGDTAVRAAADELLAGLGRFLGSDGSVTAEDGDPAPTATCCQVAAAARSAGDEALAGAVLDHLLAHRYVEERRLLHAAGDPERFELSPWLLLALPGADRAATEGLARPRLRALLASGRRRA